MGLTMRLSLACTSLQCAFGFLLLLAGSCLSAEAVQSAPSSPSAPAAAQGQATPKSSPTKAVSPRPKGAGQFPPPSANGTINFESRGMHYEGFTKNGITVMFAALPPHVKDYNIVQITVTNGSPVSWTVKPKDFSFTRQDGTNLPSVSADQVVASLLERASRNDVIKLQLLYEDTIYSLSNYRATNGYEQRREAAMAQFVNKSFAAAAAASAITMTPVKLKPGDSTDGAVFFENRSKEKNLGIGRLTAHTCGEIFSFEIFAESKTR